MSTYKEIHGKAIKSVSTDLSSPSNTGQIWYNSTSGTFKSIVNFAAWSSASPLITGKLEGSGFGTQTAGVKAGGRIPSPAGGTTSTEEYNGSAWMQGGAMNTSRQYSGGAGVLTAGLAFGGNNGPPFMIVKTEEYNGTAWTENPSPSGDMGTGRNKLAGFGTQASAIAAGGDPNSTATEEYGGTSWTAGGALSTGRQYVGGVGASNTAGLVFGGTTPPITAVTEEYNGASWTAGGSLNTSRGQVMGAGIQTAALAFGGYSTTTLNVTESYDGSTWTTSPVTLATGRYDGNGIGTQTAAVCAGGDPGYKDVTEEYNLSAYTLTAAAWASGGSLGNPTSKGCSFGSTPAAVSVGGTTPTGPITGLTELYNGTSWTANPNACPVNMGYATGGGPQTAGIANSGETPPGSGTSTQFFDGSAWTGGPARATARQNATGTGTKTAFIHVGGEWPPSWTGMDNVEEFNGSSWTAAAAPAEYPAGMAKGYAGGTSTAAVFGGGVSTGTPTYAASNTWNGSSWTSAPAMLGIYYTGGYAGTSTDAYQIGGYLAPPGGYTITTVYNGTAWATNPSTSSGTSNGTAAGQTGAPGGVLKWGGNYGTQTTCEEFTGATATFTTKTLTQS
jgi:hypothetical protein